MLALSVNTLRSLAQAGSSSLVIEMVSLPSAKRPVDPCDRMERDWILVLVAAAQAASLPRTREALSFEPSYAMTWLRSEMALESVLKSGRVESIKATLEACALADIMRRGSSTSTSSAASGGRDVAVIGSTQDFPILLSTSIALDARPEVGSPNADAE